MIRMAGACGVAIAAVLAFSGCSAPPITPEVSQELQTQVQDIAVLTARGDTADAVAAAHRLADRVRTAQAEGRITGERAFTILQRVEQLISRLARSGAAPAPGDIPQPLAGPGLPEALPPAPSAEPEPSDTAEPEPTEPPAEPETEDPAAPEPAPPPASPTEEDLPDGDSANSGSGSNNSGSGSGDSGNGSGSGSSGSSGSDGGSSGSVPVPIAPLPILVDATTDDDDGDDDGGKGRGRGRSSDD